MKRLLCSIVILTALFVPNGAFAEQKAEVPTSEEVIVRFHLVQQDGMDTVEKVKFHLFDKKGSFLGAEYIEINCESELGEITFKVPSYEGGESFYLVPSHGATTLKRSGMTFSRYSPIKLGTYTYTRNGDGAVILDNEFDFELVPEYVERIPEPEPEPEPEPTPEPSVNPDTDYARAVEQTMNDSGIDSKTEYLIWVSKKDFTVNVFTGSQGNWDYVKHFACSIGAPSTPTITGKFEYFAYQDRWTYAKYYCGPIMRFAPKGYAMHSTLIKYDGTPYDARLGMQISHGCVRIAPENINWLAQNMPLYTRVYITP